MEFQNFFIRLANINSVLQDVKCEISQHFSRKKFYISFDPADKITTTDKGTGKEIEQMGMVTVKKKEVQKRRAVT